MNLEIERRFILVQDKFPYPNEKKYINECIDSTYVSSVGEYVNEFEKKVEEYTGIKYAISTMNGTAALHLSLLLSGVGPNTEVITQSLTFVATCNAIRYCGAMPVLVDVDLETHNINTNLIEDAISPKTKAIMLAHTLGNPFDLGKIKKLCDNNSLLSKSNLAL